MAAQSTSEYVETLVIGAGQSGLTAGYHLKRRGLPFLILDANERIGDQWRRRWDSLRLFTPARFDGLAGMNFPAHKNSFPTKDEMGDFLESYAEHFDLPVQSGVRVERLSREDGRFVIETGDSRIEADQVVVAMAHYQEPKVPAFAGELDPAITQIHSKDYRGPGQLRDGDVLIVGAGNSGAEIAAELAKHGHRIKLSGRNTGQVPFNIDGFLGKNFLDRFVLRVLFHRVLTVRTPLGRKMRPKVLREGGPLIRVKSKHLATAGVERVPRTSGVDAGRPVLADGTVLDVGNVIWCTGFDPCFSWIDLPIRMGEHGPEHRSGIVEDCPGLYFLGLEFLHSLSSTMVHGVDRDGDRIAGAVERRVRERAATGEHEPALAAAGQ